MSDSQPLEWIFARRSIRRFLPSPLQPALLEQLLHAAMAAPSASNLQPWRFVVVTERHTLDALAQAHPYAGMCREAPAVIAIAADPAVSPAYWVQDCSAATENLLLAVSTLGLGAVWLGVHPREERKAPLMSLLGLPAGIELLCLVALGHPAEHKPARSQYDPAKVFHERWGA